MGIATNTRDLLKSDSHSVKSLSQKDNFSRGHRREPLTLLEDFRINQLNPLKKKKTHTYVTSEGERRKV